MRGDYDYSDDLLLRSKFLVLLPVPGRLDTYQRIGVGEAGIDRDPNDSDTSSMDTDDDDSFEEATMKSWNRLWHGLEHRVIKLV